MDGARADRDAGLRLAAVHLHRVRADVLPQGVARFLFVPMAEAVMFAMICSFILSRTLVPTMANYLLRTHAPHTDMHGIDGPLPPSRNPLVRFQRGFEARLRARSARLSRAARRWRCAHRARVRDRLSRLRARLVRAGAVSRPRFLPVGRRRPDPDACARAGRHARRGDAPTSSPTSRRRSARSFRPSELGTHGRQYRPAGQRHQHDLQQYRHHRHAGRRHPDHAQRRTTGRPRTMCATLREELPTRFPGTTFSFLPADIISQILNFGAPAPIDLQVRGPESRRRTTTTRKQLLRRLRHVPGLADARIQQSLEQPGLRRRCRPHARRNMSASPSATSPTAWSSISPAAARSRRPTGSIPTTACPTRS